jgi:hypothetical protein
MRAVCVVGSNGTISKLIHLGEEISSGGEGRVFEVVEDEALAAKVYYEIDDLYLGRLNILLATKAESWMDAGGHVSLTWPLAKLMDEGRRAVIGHLMYRVPKGSSFPLVHVFDPTARQRAFGDVSWGFPVALAMDLAGLTARIHEQAYVFGDLADKNVFASRRGRATLIDCESMQVRAPTGELFPCPVVTPQYSAPELFDVDLKGFQRTPRSDDYSLAILICRLLMEGEHPFDGVRVDADLDDDISIEQNIVDLNTRILDERRMKMRPDSMPLELMPPQVLQLARQCFGEGQRQPDRRPPARDWAATLATIRLELKVCPANDLHTYHRSLHRCPWCQHVENGFADPYPPARQRRVPAAGTGATAAPAPSAAPTAVTPRPAAPSTVGPTLRSGGAVSPRQGGGMVARVGGILGILAVAILLAVGTGAIVMVALQVENNLLRAEGTGLAQRYVPLAHWSTLTVGIVVVLLAVWLAVKWMGPAVRAALPWTSRSRTRTRWISTMLALPVAMAGVHFASPGWPAVQAMVRQAPPEGEVVFADTFSDNDRTWTSRDTRALRVGVSKGTYHIAVRRPTALVVARSRSAVRTLASAADVRVDVRARISGGSAENVFGVICRYRDDRHYYRVGVSSKGEYRVDKQSGDQSIQLQNWRKSVAIQRKKANRLQVSCIGGANGRPVMVALSVNGRRVAQVVDQGRFYGGSSPTVPQGSVALFAGSLRAAAVDVTFDNLSVRRFGQLPFIAPA